ncbi:hypothetical protein O181_034096 [Austropuccinia psidii MF-1]|uniref:Reverse transcriptase domain-containing protein n=1 Tax=Austropuccinia psidii MF-1 TaxID=1389203 RepID=A0A9Q3H7P4_9BASI|nr:hypothetical protein [Austropuccinia psidii MF-1]
MNSEKNVTTTHTSSNKRSGSSKATIGEEEEITLLRDKEGNLTSDIIKKLSLPSNGTSLVETSASLDDIPHQQPPNLPPDFPPITRDEVTNAISTLPNRKAPGPDGIPNELIKMSTTHLASILTDLFNFCLRQGQYPSKWKESRTAIIRKSVKDDYTDPRADRPIALLSTLGKLLENIINNQLMHWAFLKNSIPPGHVGGRPGKCINDAFVALALWINHK